MKIIKSTKPLKLTVVQTNQSDHKTKSSLTPLNNVRVRILKRQLPTPYANQLKNNIKNTKNTKNTTHPTHPQQETPSGSSADPMLKPLTDLSYEDLKISWTQQGVYVYLDCICGKYFFKMPPAWRLDDVRPHRLRLIELILFKDLLSAQATSSLLDKTSIPESSIHRVNTGGIDGTGELGRKNGVGIAFSGGNDSCACVALLPANSTLIYLKRVWNSPKNLIKHTPQLTCLATLAKTHQTYVVDSNIELLGTFCQIKRVGFGNDFVPSIPVILLADMCQLGFVCLGLINLYLKDGYQYQDYLSTQNAHTDYPWWNNLFNNSGLQLVLPVGGCSDRITYSICKQAGLNGQPCLRNVNGACNKCFKCFRKNFLILSDKQRNAKIRSLNQHKLTRTQFIQRQLNTEVLAKLRQRPISRIMTKRINWINDQDITPEHLKLDFEFENRYDYDLTRALVPDRLAETVLTKLDSYCQRMTPDDLRTVRQLDLSELVQINKN